MIFRAELAAKIVNGAKTVTRRPLSDNPRSPYWRERCSYRPGQEFAICPGRAKKAIAYAVVVRVTKEEVGAITDADARREGFVGRVDFLNTWEKIHGALDLDELVWRISFHRTEAVTP